MIHVSKLLTTMALTFVLFGAAACVVSDDEEGGAKSPTTNAPFAVSVQFAWESNDDFSEYAKCEIPAGAGTGTNATCNVVIPEGRLFFSKMKFVFSGSNKFERCPLIVYRPYYYVVSESAAFVPPGEEDDIDCTNAASFPNDTPVECYNGPATLLPSFPKYRELYQVANGLDSYSFDVVEAANTLFKSNNRWTSNSLTNRALTIPGEYVGNSMVNYSFQCRDEWNDEVHTITMFLYDQDTDAQDDPGGALDHFSDWNSTHP